MVGVVLLEKRAGGLTLTAGHAGQSDRRERRVPGDLRCVAAIEMAAGYCADHLLSTPAVAGDASELAPIRSDNAAEMAALGALHVWSERLDRHVILPVIGIDGARVTAGTASDVDRPHAKRSHLSERSGLAGRLLGHAE